MTKRQIFKRTTNEKFAKEDQNFIRACSAAGVEPTTRQASKWRNKQGTAYLKGRRIVANELKEEEEREEE